MEWLAGIALLVAVAVKTFDWLVLALIEVKLLLSFKASNADFTFVNAYLTAA
jgi:hypothetical protein